MTKEEIVEKLNRLNISPDEYSLGYDIKELAINIHTQPNGKYCVFILGERGRKFIIAKDVEDEGKAFDIMYKELKKDYDNNAL